MKQKAQKPQLKPIGAIVGIRGKLVIRDYLTRIFDTIGFKKNDEGLPAFAKYKGFIGAKELKINFSIHKRTHFIGINRNVQEIRYRTFEGIKMQVIVKLKVPTRLSIAGKPKSKWGIIISNLIFRLKKWSLIRTNYLNKIIISPDKIFAKEFTNDLAIKDLLSELATDDILSWGLVIIPGQLVIGHTFKNLDSFHEEMLLSRLKGIVKLANRIDQKAIEKPLNLTKREILLRDNPKALIWRYFFYLLLIIILGTALLIALLFGLAKLIGIV